MRLSHEVHAIEYGEQDKGVRVLSSGPSGQSVCLQADYCIVAVPLGVSLCLILTCSNIAVYACM